jgi:hypothetical protein
MAPLGAEPKETSISFILLRQELRVPGSAAILGFAIVKDEGFEPQVAWLKNYRRICCRWERHADNFLGMVQLGPMLILLRHL